MFSQTKAVTWAGRVITALVAVPFIPSAVMKVMRTEQVVSGMNHLGLPDNLIPTLAVLEISSVVIYLIPKTTVLGAILLTGYLGGAILTHLRMTEPVGLHIGIGIAVWLGVFLREPQLRHILPWRK